MAEIIDIEYSALKAITMDEEIVSQIERRYGVTLGKHVRQIWGKLGPIELFFESKIGLNYPLRGREWEITYSTAAGPGGEGLEGVRPGANKPLTNEDYAHLYTAWCCVGEKRTGLYVMHDGRLYTTQFTSGPPTNRLYLKELEPCGR